MTDTPAPPADPPPAPRPRPAWRADAGASSPIRAFVVTVFLAAVFGGLVVGLAALPRRPVPLVFVTVPVSEYDDPAWPVNPWADRDADLLAGRFGGPVVKAFGFQSGGRLREVLAWLGGEEVAGLPRPDSRRPVVLHVTALTALRGEAVYLLAADAHPGAIDAGWVPLADVLRAAGNRGPHTLLLLDIAHPAADAVGGSLEDDVAAGVHRALTAEPPGVPVLVPCGPGEVSLPCDAASSSAFAFYLSEGLGGAADGYGEGARPDGDVRIRELARFVAARVDRWARLTHGRRQTPTLYGPEERAADFVLVRHPDWQPLEPPAPAAPPAWLRAAWKERDDLRGGDRARRDPVAFARLTAGLLAAEDHWHHAGAGRAEETWRTARADWLRAVSRAPVTPAWETLPGAAERLPVALAAGPAAPPEAGKALAAFLAAPPEKDAELLAAWSAVARPLRATAVGLVWKQAADAPEPTAELIDRWARAAAAADPVNPLAETRSLTALAARASFRRQRLAAYPTAAVAAFLRTEDELGKLVALDPVEFAAGAEAATTADRDRRAGASRLWAASSAAAVDDAATTLDRAASGYRTAREQIGHARSARNALDGAALLLGETLPGMVAFDRPPSAAWLAVADAARVVAADSQPLQVAGLTAATARLATASDAKAVARLTAPDHRVDASEVAEQRSLLAGAALGGEGRLKLWDAHVQDVSKLHAAVRARDAGEDTAVPLIPPAEPATARRQRRAEASVRLLQLAGVAPDAPDLLRVATADASAANWAALEARLQTAWSAELPAAVRAGDARAARAVPPDAARARVWADAPAPGRAADPTAAYRGWVAGTRQPVTEDAR